ncbi:GumC family protein [Caulobacter segnis]|uniref:non-specific protein-tyrosine kinase n=1 Tax=Caulobacter segnis TaxID=88688 RepID=A0A2W5WW52_9CAUL|nr:Wzz/FepE/Etk N-terminal domain-containing protein [Caulobacter segnis]PZR32244.1 MAG: capsular biosynthesis protein [Caulobacter segnis]
MESRHAVPSGSPVSHDEGVLDLQRHIATFRRHFWLMAGVGAVVFVLLAGFLLQRPASYTATAEILLDSRKQNMLDVKQVGPGAAVDTSAVDTEVEVLKSRQLADTVITEKRLDLDPEFNGAIGKPSTKQSMLEKLGFAAKPQKPVEAADKVKARERMVDDVLSRLTVERSGGTYVIRIGFRAGDPVKAAAIANAYANAYLTQQLRVKLDATQTANQWLNSRLSGLRSQVEAAEAAVQRYKAENGLLSADGTTLTEQNISTLNNQLAEVRASQAEQEARLNTARRQLASGSAGDDVGEALNSPVIQQLRAQRAEVSRRVADLSNRYGPRYPDLLKAQREAADLDGQIQSEIKRVISNLSAQADVARQRTASVEASLNRTRGTLAANNAASVQLNELERNAESVRTLYQSYLDRFKQTSTQQGVEQTDARVISPARVPTSPSAPNVPKSLALAIAAALVAGVGSVFAAAALETGLSTSEEIEEALDTPHLASVPLLSSTLAGQRSSLAPIDYVVEKPLSAFAESFRNLRAAIAAGGQGKAPKVVLFTSALPGEGKTSTSIGIGRTAAMAGLRTIIVDCDLRRRGVTRAVDLKPQIGLLEVLLKGAPLADAIVLDEKSGAYLLPLNRETQTSRDVFNSPEMATLLTQLRERFDFVVLDGPPVLPVADSRVLAPRTDAVVLLARWRKTPKRAVQEALREINASGAYLAGAALTQVDVVKQSRAGYGDAGYYYKAYSQYYLD